jgi:hypothetical protein
MRFSFSQVWSGGACVVDRSGPSIVEPARAVERGHASAGVVRLLEMRRKGQQRDLGKLPDQQHPAEPVWK